MKGYIYITSSGADPAHLDNLNDPVFGDQPSLGACMPNIRRFVGLGDYIFVVSGSTAGVQQYVIGGMQVAEKISPLEAYARFPNLRLRKEADGRVKGNVVINADGSKHPLDNHRADTFAERVKNYVVGTNAVSLATPAEVALGRQQTLGKLGQVIGKSGNRPIDIMGRLSRLDQNQIGAIVDWLRGIKRSAA